MQPPVCRPPRLNLLVAVCLLAGLLAGRAADQQQPGGNKTTTAVELQAVPKAVLDTANRTLPGLKLTAAEKIATGSTVLYELEGQVGNSTYELTVKADGTLLLATLEDEDADEDEDEDKDEDDTPGAKPKAKPGVKPEPGVKPKAKPEAKPEATKPEPSAKP